MDESLAELSDELLAQEFPGTRGVVRAHCDFALFILQHGAQEDAVSAAEPEQGQEQEQFIADGFSETVSAR